MKFDELDDKMRVFETAHDLCILPGIYMVARLDGRITGIAANENYLLFSFDPVAHAPKP